MAITKNGRVSNKHDKEENWLKAKKFIPLDGEIIFYDPDLENKNVRMKVGNGVDFVNDLPFFGGEIDLSAYAKKEDLTKEVQALIDAAPEALDTLKELAAALGNDPNFVTTILEEIPDNIKDGEGKGALEQLHDSETWTGIDAEGNEVNYETKASGKFSTIYGGKSYAEGGRSLAGGTKSVAKGSGSMAFGDTNYAGDYATAFGYQTRALGAYSHTEGRQTLTEESNAHAEGSYTKAKGNSSHAEGSETIAEGLGSHAEGLVNKAIGEGSHAEGINTLASGQSSHSEGEYAYATGTNSHAEGGNTFAKGWNSHAEGSQANAYGDNSHAEGSLTHSNGENSHAEGDGTIAEGNASHAEGTNTKASQDEAHAEGWETEASGHHSHSEGQQTKAIGDNSHAGGRGTIAVGEAQTVIGRYNIENSDALFIIGNGNDNENRKNVFTVNNDGTATIQTSGTNDLNIVNYKQLKDYVSKNGNRWNNACEMLFSTGKVQIKNGTDENSGSILIGYPQDADELSIRNSSIYSYSKATFGSFYIEHGYLSLEGEKNQESAKIFLSKKYTTLNNDGSENYFSTDLIIDVDNITVNGKTITWDRLFAAIEKIENM